MNKEKFIELYQNFCHGNNLNPKDVVVSAGGAMVILGIRRTTNDLDLDVEDSFYERMGRCYGFNKTPFGENVNVNILIDLHRRKPDTEVVCVDGVYIYSIKDLIKQKQALLAEPTHFVYKRIEHQKDLNKLQQVLEKYRG